MKRENYLIEHIAAPENLRLAFWKAQRTKSGHKDVMEFRRRLDANLTSLRNEILCGEVCTGDYRYFTIHDPKERLICAASFRERVLHHALINICHNNFERYQIFDSYACRSGKGTYAALERAEKFQHKYQWFLKMDIRKYFYSISHSVLKDLLQRRFKEDKLLNIFGAIIDSYSASTDCGLPIGNLTSQYFANHYLALADRYVLEDLHIPAYVRYMDDMVLWTNSKTQLLTAGRALEQFVNETLHLHLKEFCLNSTNKGLPFLGYLLYPHKTFLGRNSRQRFAAKLAIYSHKLMTDEWTQYEYQQHVLPLLAFTSHANARGWRSSLFLPTVQFRDNGRLRVKPAMTADACCDCGVVCRHCGLDPQSHITKLYRA
jgi:retron-type reverse transcriptase